MSDLDALVASWARQGVITMPGASEGAVATFETSHGLTAPRSLLVGPPSHHKPPGRCRSC